MEKKVKKTFFDEKIHDQLNMMSYLILKLSNNLRLEEKTTALLNLKFYPPSDDSI